MAGPTYYLSSLESARFAPVRSCVVRRVVHFDTGKEALLVDVDPAVVGQDFGRSTDISTVLLAARHEGQGLDPVTEFPSFVHIAISDDTGSASTPIRADDFQTIAWGELYRTAEDARHHRFG